MSNNNLYENLNCISKNEDEIISSDNDIKNNNFTYPKTIENMTNLNKRSISKHDKFLKNPGITHFNAQSQFIYDIDEGINFLKI